MTTLLINGVQCYAIVWRPDRSQSYYWIGEASLRRLVNLARRGPLVRRDGNEDTYSLDLANPCQLDTMEAVANEVERIMADCNLPGWIVGGRATQRADKSVSGLRLNVQWDCIAAQQVEDCRRLTAALQQAFRCGNAGIDADAPTWIVMADVQGVQL